MESARGIKSGRRRRREAPARPTFAFIDDDAIARLKARAFDLLDGHGVVVVHPEGAQALKLAGATPGRDGEHARHEMADVVAAADRHILAKAATHSGPVLDI